MIGTRHQRMMLCRQTEYLPPQFRSVSTSGVSILRLIIQQLAKAIDPPLWTIHFVHKNLVNVTMQISSTSTCSLTVDFQHSFSERRIMRMLPCGQPIRNDLLTLKIVTSNRKVSGEHGSLC
jgi:hypothetical protein